MEAIMRHTPRFSDDYGFTGSSASDTNLGAIYAKDIDEMFESYGDDWSLDSDEFDVELLH
jgi:hypothetical protein